MPCGLLTLGIHKRAKHSIPHTTLGEIDQRRKDNEGHRDEECECQQGIFRAVDSNVHDLDGAVREEGQEIEKLSVKADIQKHLILIFECPEDPQ